MAHFIQVGRFQFNMDLVKSIYIGKDDRCVVRFIDKSAEEFSGRWTADEFRSMNTKTSQVVSANPGFFLVSAWISEDCSEEHMFEQQPVVAWRIHQDLVEPVVLESLTNSTSRREAVLRPDGVVISPFDQQWDTISDWKAWAKEERKSLTKVPLE